QLRAEIEPVDQQSYARYLVQQHQVVPAPQERGIDGLTLVLDQLTGLSAPAQVWETALLPARISDYQPAMLDKLLSTGQCMLGGPLRSSRAFHHLDTGGLYVPNHRPRCRLANHGRSLTACTGSDGRFCSPLAAQRKYQREELLDALSALFGGRQVTNDAF